MMDAVGSNIVVDTRCGEVMRILPRMNEVGHREIAVNGIYYTNILSELYFNEHLCQTSIETVFVLVGYK